MAFFESLSRKLTSAGQEVAQQTKSFAEVTKLNSSIAEKERKINALYVEIGRHYYQQHKQDPMCEQQQSIAQILDLESQIAQCQQQIKQIKGITKCPDCGGDVPANARFCNTCGRKMEEAAPQNDVVICPVCGATIEADCLFCTACGSRIAAPEETTVTEEKPETEAEVEVETEESETEAEAETEEPETEPIEVRKREIPILQPAREPEEEDRG